MTSDKGPAWVSRRGGALILALITALHVLHLRPALAQLSADESTLKAAFVSKFPQFIDWPPSVWTRSSFDLCVIAPEAFAEALRTLVAGELLQEQEIRVRQVAGGGELGTCAVLFVSRASVKTPRTVLDAARERPILTVGDSDTFLDEGGMIGLRVIGGRVRFEVNPAVAGQAGLQISSQLLRLAVSVRGAE